jgi:hypothetical protein
MSETVGAEFVKVLFVFAVLKISTQCRPGLILRINFECIDKAGGDQK